MIDKAVEHNENRRSRSSVLYENLWGRTVERERILFCSFLKIWKNYIQNFESKLLSSINSQHIGNIILFLEKLPKIFTTEIKL